MQVSAIYIYPIKSIGGCSLPKSKITSRGLAFDRRFMLTTPDGKFMTQRTNRRMALLKTQLLNNTLLVWDSNFPVSKIEIPIQPQHFVKQQEVTIWNDTCLGNVLHPHINQWFSKRLGQACQLVYMPEQSKRLLEEPYRKGEEVVSFADAYPVLLLGQSGMDRLNAKLDQPVSINRFRANIIFTGGQPFEEDKWKSFKIGKQLFRGVKPCKRCNVLNINQTTANIEKEPNRTLATFRKFEKGIYVGMNVCWEGKGRGSIQVGDKIVKN